MWQSVCQQVSLHSYGTAGATIQLTSAWKGHHHAVHVPERRPVPSIRDLDPHQLLKAPLKNLDSQAFLTTFDSPENYLKGSSLSSIIPSLTLSASLRFRLRLRL